MVLFSKLRYFNVICTHKNLAIFVCHFVSHFCIVTKTEIQKSDHNKKIHNFLPTEKLRRHKPIVIGLDLCKDGQLRYTM